MRRPRITVEGCAAVLVLSSASVFLLSIVYRTVLPAVVWLACTGVVLYLNHRRRAQ